MSYPGKSEPAARIGSAAHNLNIGTRHAYARRRDHAHNVPIQLEVDIQVAVRAKSERPGKVAPQTAASAVTQEFRGSADQTLPGVAVGKKMVTGDVRPLAPSFTE